MVFPVKKQVRPNPTSTLAGPPAPTAGLGRPSWQVLTLWSPLSSRCHLTRLPRISSGVRRCGTGAGAKHVPHLCFSLAIGKPVLRFQC